VKVALVTTSAPVPSAIGRRVHALVPYLCELCELRLFAEPDAQAGELLGVPLAPISALDPRAHERLLFELGNEPAQAFMPRVIRCLGGTVMLHDWVLSDLASAAFPALRRGGLAGYLLALREGGPVQARLHARLRCEQGAERLASDERLALNRSVVRHADSFLVHTRSMAERILRERNARTPIGMVDAEAVPSALARAYVEQLEDLPGPRATRRARIAFGSLWTAGRQKPARSARAT